jgi:hypothetical protein
MKVLPRACLKLRLERYVAEQSTNGASEPNSRGGNTYDWPRAISVFVPDATMMDRISPVIWILGASMPKVQSGALGTRSIPG